MCETFSGWHSVPSHGVALCLQMHMASQCEFVFYDVLVALGLNGARNLRAAL